MVDQFGVISHDFEGGRIFALEGELDACTCRGLAEHLIGPPGSLVVIDLCQLAFIDSSGLGAIHAARRRAIKDGGTLVVCRPNPMVHRIFEITGLDTWVMDWDPGWACTVGAGVDELAVRDLRDPNPSIISEIACSGDWGGNRGLQHPTKSTR